MLPFVDTKCRSARDSPKLGCSMFRNCFSKGSLITAVQTHVGCLFTRPEQMVPADDCEAGWSDIHSTYDYSDSDASSADTIPMAANRMPSCESLCDSCHRQCAHSSDAARVVILCERAERASALRVCDALNNAGLSCIIAPSDISETILTITSSLSLVCPIISTSFLSSLECEKALTVADSLGVVIAPIWLHSQGHLDCDQSWLSDMNTSLSLRLSGEQEDDCSFNNKMVKFASALKLATTSLQAPASEPLFKGTAVKGYYRQYEYLFSLNFSFFCMVNGVVAGHGSDMIGSFVVIGRYSKFEIEFRVQYLRKGGIDYKGTIQASPQKLSIAGEWMVEANDGTFRIDLPLNGAPARNRSHVMLSCHAEDYHHVQRVATSLRSKGLKVWVNEGYVGPESTGRAMVRGVNEAAVVVSCVSKKYLTCTRCQKELTYANQLGRPILIMRLDDTRFEDDWLGSIVNSLRLEAIDISNESGVSEGMEMLWDQLKGIIPQLQLESAMPEHDVVLEGGRMSGYYWNQGAKHTMRVEFLSVRDEQIIGHGDDEGGAFIIDGCCSDNEATFVKQYVGEHQIHFQGRMERDQFGALTITGAWGVGRVDEAFYLCTEYGA